MATTAPDKTWTLKVTERELTLIRIACLLRLDRLKQAPTEEMRGSYDATRAMMDVGGCLHRPTIEEDNATSATALVNHLIEMADGDVHYAPCFRDCLSDNRDWVAEEIAKQR